MAQVDIYKMDGKTSGTIELSDRLFGVDISPEVVHEAIVAQRANARITRAHTKDRSEVRGGGRKPWKQKGTGRARHGSRRSPIWVGGGVTFGPTLDRIFGKKINKKTKRKAMAMMLTDKVSEKRFVVLEAFDMPEAKTKFIAKMRSVLPGAEETALIVTTKEDMDVVRAAKNLPKTQTISATSLNVRDLAKYAYVIASKAAVEEMTKHYA